jgi:hypothetical protein
MAEAIDCVGNSSPVFNKIAVRRTQEHFHGDTLPLAVFGRVKILSHRCAGSFSEKTTCSYNGQTTDLLPEVSPQSTSGN